MTPIEPKPDHAAVPMVSCLLLTADRPSFVPHAIRSFLDQDYPSRELIVLDDGKNSVESLIPADRRIRYVRLPVRHTIGAKRNAGCETARGELIAHWDDDDWMADWRLSYQVEELLRYNADVCGLRKLYFWGPHSDQSWEYTYEYSSPPWVAGGTMLYRRSLWENNPFPDLDVGEDNAFVWSDVPKSILPLVDLRFYVATIHAGNTSPKLTSTERWQPVGVGEVRQIIGEEWEDLTKLIFSPPPDTLEETEAIASSDEPVPFFSAARRDHLGLLEFAAFNDAKSVPWMRRWELPFAIFKARLEDTMAVLDCSINSADLGQWIAELYPHLLYRYSQPLFEGRFLAPPMAPDNSFDRVFCLNTIEHFPAKQREELMAMLAAKLKPGGWLVITADGYFDSSWAHKDWLATGLIREDREEVFNGLNKVTPSQLETLCARHGLLPLAATPAEPLESDRGLYLNQPPLQHASVGAVFSKGPQRESSRRRKVLLSLLTWNTCVPSLESLAAHVREARMLQRLGIDAEICVVDNGSADGTAEELRKLAGTLEAPHHFILNSENVGNSRARNQTIHYMLECGADYILFVDGDIEIVPFSSFVMLRHMESCGSRVGCVGAYSFGCTPDRSQTTPYLYSLAGCQIQSSDTLAWTQYGMFRRQLFEDGARFDEGGPFGEPGHGLEDVDLAFQMNQLGYLNHYFSGISYLHRNISSSVGILSEHGLEPTERYYQRKEYMLRKWEDVPLISEGPLNWVRQARAPWSEPRAGRGGEVSFSPSSPAIAVPGEVIEWVDQAVSDMLDRTELMALAATLTTFDWRLSDLLVEIGAYLGTTTVFMAKVLEQLGRRVTILSIDPFERCTPDNLNPQGNYSAYIENIRAHGVANRCLAQAAFSADAAATVPNRIGVLVVDGAHHYDAVRADLELYVPKVVPGGYVFLDDYGPAYPDVIRAIDEYLPAHPELEIIVKSYYVILRRAA